MMGQVKKNRFWELSRAQYKNKLSNGQHRCYHLLNNSTAHAFIHIVYVVHLSEIKRTEKIKSQK